MILEQKYRSLIALGLCVLFLWTGKKFVWADAGAPEIPYVPEDSTVTDHIPAETTTLPDMAQSIPQMTSTEQDITSAGTDLTAELNGTDTADSSSSTFTSTVTQEDAAASTPQSSSAEQNDNVPPADTDPTTAPTTTTSTETTTSTAAPAPSAPGFAPAPEGYFNDALFIGDSRTVGQASYGPIEGASYFATVGMSTANIYKSKSEVAPTKGMTFEGVMTSAQYSKVYVMLGINELGNDRAATLKNFGALLEKIKSYQPNAVIIIEANLHVTAARSQQNIYGVNNTQINAYNQSLSEYADNQTVFYLDVNPIFDDASGALAAEYTRDGVHPVATNYPTWADWLKQNAVVK